VVINAHTGGTITHVGVGLTFGLVVMAMIYAIGDVSGAHINPAVTIGFWVARRFPGNKVPGYIVCQCAGALAASGLLRLLFPAAQTLGETLTSLEESLNTYVQTYQSYDDSLVVICAIYPAV
jgi:aquaporin NIP